MLDLHTYSAEQVKKAVDELKKIDVSIIFCSSKTWVEQEYYRRELGIDEPAIVENGSGIYLPDGTVLSASLATQKIHEKDVAVLGQVYTEVVDAIEQSAKVAAADFKYYHNQSIDELVQITGLSESGAQKAKTRDFSETLFNVDQSSETYQIFKKDQI